MKSKTLKVSFISIVILFSGLNCNEKKSQEHIERKINLMKALNLSKVHEDIRFNSSSNCAAFDKSGNMYYTDSNNHRLIKINEDGKFTGYLGEQGEKPENLYQPEGVFCRDDIIYVLDYYGQKVKQFSLDGNFISQFKLKEVELTNSIYVDENFIYLNALYKNQTTYSQRKVVTVVTKEGKKFTEIGKLIETNDMFSYQIFNHAALTVLNGRIYIAFQLVPKIVAYDIEGNKVLDIDLTKKDLEAIVAAQFNAEQKGHDTAATAKGARIRTTVYCGGFASNKKNDIYYSSGSFIYRFNQNFNMTGHLSGMKKNGNIHLGSLLRDHIGFAWVLAIKNKQVFRFKIN